MATTPIPKQLNTRIALKYDSYSAWTTSPGKDLVLLAGEIGICHIEAANQGSQVVPTVLFKVGDGTSTFEQLPWASAKAADVYNWAKASDVAVVYNADGTKAIKFVGGAVDANGNKIDKLVPINFATPEEVKDITDGLASRIATLEDKFTGDGSVSNLIDTAKQEAIDAAAADATTKANTAEANAKAYTDEQIGTAAEAAVGKEGDENYVPAKEATGIRKEIADAEAVAKSYADGIVASEKSAREAADSALGERIDALVGDNGTIATGDAATLEAAKAYADGLAGNYDAEGSAADAEQAAKDYADDEIEKVVNAQATTDAGQDALIQANATAISNEADARENADKAINDKIGGSFDATNTVAKAISDAQTNAEANAATTAQGKVDALANGAVAANTAAISAMDAAYKKAVEDEAKARDDADKALSDRIDGIDAFFATAEGETLDTALDTLKEIQDYLNGEGSATSGMLGRLTQAEADIDDLEEVVGDANSGLVKTVADHTTEISGLDGRLTTAEGEIDTLQAASHTHENQTELDKIADGDKAKWDEAYAKRHEHANKTELDKIAEGDKAKWDTAATTASTAAADLAALVGENGKITVAEDNIETLQSIVKGYTDEGSIKAAIEAAQKAADDAQDAADNAQDEVDALELVVNDPNTGLAKTKAIADKATTDLADLTTRVGNAESDIDALEAIVKTGNDTNAKLRSDITELQGIVKTGADANATLRSDLTTLQNIVNNETTGLAATKAIADDAKTKAEDAQSRVAAIERDYLKEADQYIFNCGSSTTVVHEKAAASN